MNAFHFTGREWSPATGQYYLRARWLQPSAGGFASVDPDVEDLRDGRSPYAYVRNRPAIARDLDGRRLVIAGSAYAQSEILESLKLLCPFSFTGPANQNETSLDFEHWQGQYYGAVGCHTGTGASPGCELLNDMITGKGAVYDFRLSGVDNAPDYVTWNQKNLSKIGGATLRYDYRTEVYVFLPGINDRKELAEIIFHELKWHQWQNFNWRIPLSRDLDSDDYTAARNNPDLLHRMTQTANAIRKQLCLKEYTEAQMLESLKR